MRLLAMVAVFVIAACTGGEQPGADSAGQHTSTGATPVFEVGLWPGEGVPVINAVRRGLPLSRSPSSDAVLAGTLDVAAGSRIDYDSTRLQTLVPATVSVADSSAAVHGRFLGAMHSLSRERYYSDAFRDTTIHLETSEHFEYLQPRAEGTCFVRIDSSLIEASLCPTHDTARFTVSGEPELRWWVFVTGDSASGWLLVSDSTAQVVRREF